MGVAPETTTIGPAVGGGGAMRMQLGQPKYGFPKLSTVWTNVVPPQDRHRSRRVRFFFIERA
jgi:hypothetical protein